jgi:hypothetical protein
MKWTEKNISGGESRTIVPLFVNPSQFSFSLYLYSRDSCGAVCTVSRDRFPEEVGGEVVLVRHGIAHAGPQGDMVTTTSFTVSRAAGDSSFKRQCHEIFAYDFFYE